jgi:hypothetical protein
VRRSQFLLVEEFLEQQKVKLMREARLRKGEKEKGRKSPLQVLGKSQIWGA